MVFLLQRAMLTQNCASYVKVNRDRSIFSNEVGIYDVVDVVNYYGYYINRDASFFV